jgi:hypothetical protein
LAQHGQIPGMDLAAGAQALAETLPKVLAARGATQLSDLGWKKVGANTLLIPFEGRIGEATETFLLKLHFRTGRDFPPSAQFVNPETLSYDPARDQGHLPALTSSHCYMHAAYSGPRGPLQLICCSATYEYYEIGHGGEDRHLWRDSDTFLVTLCAIERAFASNYGGRMPANA